MQNRCLEASFPQATLGGQHASNATLTRVND
jgi:hypothetical protein